MARVTTRARNDNSSTPQLFIFNMAISGGIQIGDYLYDKSTRQYYTVIAVEYYSN